MRDVYESQAKYFASIPLLKKGCIASVHVEDKADSPFWLQMLQYVRSGEYYIVSQSRSGKGNNTSGCEQCLKYRRYLSKKFFIAIDSDLRNVAGEEGLAADNFVAQTYTYSWENHCCEAKELQSRFEQAMEREGKRGCFDFSGFLAGLSELMFVPFMYVCCQKVFGLETAPVSMADIFGCMPSQVRSEWLDDNGKALLKEVKSRLSELNLAIPQDLYGNLSMRLERCGITRDNVYLHVRGHNMYDMIQHIGIILCHGTRISFTNDVLQFGWDKEPEYWQYQRLISDLRAILS